MQLWKDIRDIESLLKDKDTQGSMRNPEETEVKITKETSIKCS